MNKMTFDPTKDRYFYWLEAYDATEAYQISVQRYRDMKRRYQSLALVGLVAFTFTCVIAGTVLRRRT